MRRLTTLFAILMICVSTLFAQAPNKFSYQAVVRNTSNQLVVNTLVGIRVSILQNSATGSVVYSETQMLSTNANGLVTMNIGEGTVIYGSFNNIDWSAGTFFLKSEIDPTGGTNYSISSTQQLLSVPYAQYANEAGNSFSGDYNDLTNKPTIPTVPTNVSAFTNDAGYITGYTETDPVFTAWDKNYNDLTNKPTLFSGNYNDLTNKPTLFSGNYNDLTNKPTIPTVPTVVSAFTNDAGYLTGYTETDPVFSAWDKNYNDLTNKPTIPTVPTNVSAFTNDANYLTGYTETDPVFSAWDKSYNDLTNKPTLFSGNYNDLTNKPTLFSGNYNDLTNKPTIPTVPTNVSAFTNDAGYLTGYTETDPVFTAWDKNYNDLTNKPTLFSGNYNDLTNKPTIPTVPSNVSAFNNDAGYITGYTETDPVFTAWDKNYNDLTNKPTLFSGNYNDLTNKPTIPAAANNATLTIQRNNSTVGTFTADASSDKTVNISVPTTTSELTNNSGYITADQLDALLNAMNSRMDSLQTVLSAQNVEIASLSNTVDSLGAYADSLGNIVDECGCLSTFHCGTSTISDYDGNAYSTVKLGGQCWMAENLRTTHYSNGDPIDLGTTTSTTIPYRYNPASDSANVGTYGYLYNWVAVMNSVAPSEANPSGVQGICPTGWHVPSDAEWTELETFVSIQSQYVCNHQNSSYIGKALASTTGWNNSTTTACGVGTTQSTNNATGFNARPAGNYYASGGNGFGYYANFWTTTKMTNGNAYYYNLSYTSPSLNRSNSGEASGFSVRCVRD